MTKREVQIHAVVTILGDPFGITEEERKDVDLGQIAVSYPPEAHGLIKVSQVKRSFEALGVKCLQKMRAAGLLKAGE